MSNTAKRFFKNNWENPSFSQLSSSEKLLYKYLWERCNIGGVYELNYPIMSAYLGYQVDKNLVDELIKKIDELEWIDSHFVWFSNFIRYQQKESGGALSATSPPHKSAVKCLRMANIYDVAYKRDPDLFQAYPKPTLSQGLINSYSNSNGNGTSNGTSSGSGSGSGSGSKYGLSKSIAARINQGKESIPHTLVQRVNEVINRLEEKNIDSPFNTIEDTLNKMESYYPKSELTIQALEEKLGLGSPPLD